MKVFNPWVVITLLLTALSFSSLAEITDTGDVQVIGNDLYIGNSSDGFRLVVDEMVNHDNTYLGNAPDVSGILRVSKTLSVPCGPVFTNKYDIVVGNIGSGSLHVDNLATDCTAPKMVSNRIILGNEVGSNGFTNSTHFDANELIVGNAGTGIVNNGSDVLSVPVIKIADQPGGDGTVEGAVNIGNTGTGSYLGVGVAGAGVLQQSTVVRDKFSDYPFNYGAINIGGPGAIDPVAELGVNTDANGTIPIFEGEVSISGNNASLAVGVNGSGSVDISTVEYYNNNNLYSASLTVEDSETGNAQSYIAKYPGSTGEVAIGGIGVFNAGDVLRIGLDENDNPGGDGVLTMNKHGLDSKVTAGVIKVGPGGRIDSLHNASFPSAFPISTINSDVVSEGLVNLRTTIIGGDFTNTGTVFVNPTIFLEGVRIVGGNYHQGSDGILKLVESYNTIYEPLFSIAGTAEIDGDVEFIARSTHTPTSELILKVINVDGGVTWGPDFSLALSGLSDPWTTTPVFDANGLSVVYTYPEPVSDLAIMYTATPSDVFVGQLVTYTVTVTNNGPETAFNVFTVGSVNISFGTLEAGASKSSSSTKQAITAGVFTQTMTVSGYANDTNPSNDSASVTINVTERTANLSLTLTGPATAVAGETINYTVTLTNNGPQTASNVTATGTLPDCTPQNGSKSLASGESLTCVSTLTADAAGTLTQSMTVTGDEVDPDSSNNSASVSTEVQSIIDLEIAMTDAPDPVKKGAKLTYSITVSNISQLDATGVTLTDLLPEDIRLESIDPSQGNCPEVPRGSNQVVCDLGIVAGGSSANVIIVIKPMNVGTLVNSASVAANENEINEANNEVSIATTVYKK